MNIRPLVVLLLSMAVGCAKENNEPENLRWKTPYDHLVPLSLAWDNIPRDDIVSFRSTGGLIPTIGWSLRRTGMRSEDYRYMIVLWDSEHRTGLASAELSARSAERIHKLFLNLLQETRYPEIEGDEPRVIRIRPPDSPWEQSVVRARGIEAMKGEAGSYRSDRVLDFIDFQRRLYVLSDSGELVEERILQEIPGTKRANNTRQPTSPRHPEADL